MKREFVKTDIDIDPFFFNMFSRLGSDVECEIFPKELSGYSLLLEPFLERLYAKNNQSPPKLNDRIDLPCYNIEENKKVLVAISGGHDSLAVAIQLKKDGYEPKRFVYASSSMVYGDFLKSPADEEHPTKPKEIYGTMKLAGEQVTKGLSRYFGIKSSIIRPSAVYGPTDMNRRVSQIFLEQAIKKQKISIQGFEEKLDFSYANS